MSFVRFTEDGSDIYLYDVAPAVIECSGCKLFGNFFGNYDEMINHVADHRAAGHHVPAWVEDELRDDQRGDGVITSERAR